MSKSFFFAIKWMCNDLVSKKVQITLKNASALIKFKVKLHKTSEEGWWSEEQMEPAKLKLQKMHLEDRESEI